MLSRIARKCDYISAEDQQFLKRVETKFAFSVLPGILIPGSWHGVILILILMACLMLLAELYRRRYLRKRWQEKNIELTSEEKELLLFYIQSRVQEDEVKASDVLMLPLLQKDILYRTKVSETREGYRMQHWAREYLKLNKHMLRPQ